MEPFPSPRGRGCPIGRERVRRLFLRQHPRCHCESISASQAKATPQVTIHHPTSSRRQAIATRSTKPAYVVTPSPRKERGRGEVALTRLKPVAPHSLKLPSFRFFGTTHCGNRPHARSFQGRVSPKLPSFDRAFGCVGSEESCRRFGSSSHGVAGRGEAALYSACFLKPRPTSAKCRTERTKHEATVLR